MNSTEKLVKAVFKTWVEEIVAGLSWRKTDYFALREYVDRLGFTGPFTGLDRHFSKETLIAVLDNYFNEK